MSSSSHAVAQQEALLAQLMETLQRKNPRLAQAVRLGALPRWLDREVLAAARGEEDGLEEKILARLRRFSFVNEEPSPLAGRDGQEEETRLVYSREMRRFLLDWWLAQDLAGYLAGNRRLRDYFQAWLDAHTPQDPRYDEYLLAHLYHALAVDPAAGMERLAQLFAAAEANYRPAAGEQLLALAEEQTPRFSPQEHAQLELLRARLDQLYERWEASRRRLEPLLEQPDLAPAIKVEARRILARTLIQEREWLQAIQLLREAGTICQEYKLERQTAQIMAALGDAYLDFAFHAWGQAQFSLTEKRGWLGMDPVLLKLFALAEMWYQRAEKELKRLGDQDALLDVEEQLARLALTMDLARRAVRLYRQVLAQGQDRLEPYRQARIRLELAYALAQNGKLAEARHILEQILPVFQAYGHRRRQAQTRMLLAQIHAREERYPEAVAEYEQALALWQELGEEEAVTELAHQMEELARQEDVDDTLKERLRALAGSVTRRVYATRYRHPLSALFGRISLVALAVLFFMTLLLGFRTQSGTSIRADAALIRPVQQPIPAAEELSPTVSLTVQQQLQPTVDAQVVTPVVAGSLLAYLLLYAGLTLYLFTRARLEDVQQAQRRRLVVDTQAGVSREEGGADLAHLEWSQVNAMVVADRRIRRRPWPGHSYFALFGPAQRIVVPGLTRRYQALQEWIRQHLPASVPVHDLGFSILGSRSGLLFLLALIYLALFALLTQLAPSWLTARLHPFPYALADLFGLSLLGIGLPLGYWFVIQPMRARVAEDPRTPVVWLGGLLGLFFGLLAILQINLIQLPLGRPDIAMGLVAAGITGLAAHYMARLRVTSVWGQGHGDAPHVYPRPVRLVAGILAGLVLLGTLLSVGRELYSFHFLVTGNARLQQAETLALTQPEDAEQLLEQAVAAYQRSLRLRPEASAFNSLGAALTELGRFQEAIQAYERAVQEDPSEPIYLSNLALAYTDWASRTQDPQLQDERYVLAWEKFAQALAQMEARPERYQAQMETVRLLRGGASFQRGKYFADELEEYDTALEHYRSAFQDYTWVIDHGTDPQRVAAAYASRGWVYFWFARLDSETVEEERAFYEKAFADFQAAAELNPNELSAFTGLGWANYYMGLTYPRCVADTNDPAGAEERARFMQRASDAYAQVIRLQPQAAIHYRVKAQLDWILKNCPGYDYVDQLKVAIQDYAEAIRRDPSRAHWYFRQANMYYDLGNQLAETDPEGARQAYEQAAQGYIAAIQRNPENPAYVAALRTVYRLLGQDPDQAFVLVAEAQGLSPQSPESYLALGQQVLEAGRGYALMAANAFRKAVELDPENAQAYWLLGKALFDAGRREEAIEPLVKASQLDPENPDPVWLLGWTYFILGRNEQALEAGLKFLSLVPEDHPKVTDRYYLLARVYHRLGERENALGFGERALAEVPSLAHVAQLARIFRDFGSASLLIQAGERALALAPGDPRGHFWQGLGYALAGDMAQAKARYQAGLEALQQLADPDERRSRRDEALADLAVAVERGFLDQAAAQELQALLGR